MADENTLPSHTEILGDLKKLVNLMEDPHPGLSTWLSARIQLAKVVAEKLKLVLGGSRVIYVVRNCGWEDHGTPDAFEDLETAKAQPYAETIWVVELNKPRQHEHYWHPERTHDHNMKPIPKENWNWVEYEYKE